MPWSKDTRDVGQAIKSFGLRKSFVALLVSWLLPAKWIACLFRIPRKGDNSEAALLFTSGSEGMPKAVVLTHRNLLANIAQINASALFPQGNTLLACLPIFHSFGFTVTLWYPIIAQLRVVTSPSPVDYKRIGKIIHEESVTALLGTPTFYKAYLKHIDSKWFSSLRCVVAGAEKTPSGLAEEWEKRLGSHYLEGYGLTETAPVVSVNLVHDILTDNPSQETLQKKDL